jgi:hypothetical protein
MEDLYTLLQFLEKIAIIGGIFYAIFTLRQKSRSNSLTEAGLQLNHWEKLQAILVKDLEIRECIFSFLKNYDQDEIQFVEDLKAKYKSGKMMYLSPELKEFSKIGRHYELLGATIRFKYLPIKFLNEVIPFPDEFWNRTEILRKVIEENWFEEHSPLIDFWKNFGWMRVEWHKRR